MATEGELVPASPASNMTIEWIDMHREPQVKPNPAYPTGIDVIATTVGVPNCYTALPYPARRIGHYKVTCNICGLVARVTTAGRTDDPRSLTIACRPMAQA